MGGSPVVTEARREPARSGRWSGLPRWLAEAAYVLCITAVAAWGFYSDSTALILLAVLLALPMGAAALVGYYVVYGVLAAVSGASPDTYRMNSNCSGEQGDACYSFTTGETAEWFLNTMDLIGVLALAAAAVLNAVLLRIFTAHRRNHKQSLAYLRQ